MSQQHSSELSNQSEQLRNELLQLNRQRNKIESEIKEWQEVLKTVILINFDCLNLSDLLSAFL